MHSNLLKNIYSVLLYSAGICVVIAAVAVTVIRLTLPDIGSYRSEIEAWVSRYAELPVVIRSVDAEWSGWIPHLYLKDIELMDKSGESPVIHFREAQISIAPLSSLLKRQIIPRQLVISGFSLSVTQLNDGALLIQGIDLGIQPQQQNTENDLAKWLFSQNRIELQDVDIEWLDIKRRQAPVALSDVTLLLRSDADAGRLQIEGTAQLPPDYGNNLGFAFDSHGNLLGSDWSGELYLQATNINPEGWYSDLLPAWTDITGGHTSLSLWSTWEKARLTGLAGQLEMNDFSASVNDSLLHVEKLDSRFAGKQDVSQTWRFDIHLDDLITPNGRWPETDLAILIEPMSDGSLSGYTVSFSYLKLDDLIPIIKSMPDPPGEGKMPDFTGQFTVGGNLSNGWINYNPEAGVVQCDFNFDNLTITNNQIDTELLNLSGNVAGSTAGGRISFLRDKAEIKLPSVRREPVQLAAIDGEISWLHDKSGFSVSTDLLQITNADLTARFAGTAVISEDSPLFIDVRVALDDANPETVVSYIPSTVNFRARDWLEKAVSGGELSSARAVFRGYLRDFPFDNNEGLFKAVAGISNTTLEYSPQWPGIHISDADVVLAGRKLIVDNARGSIFNADIADAYAVVPDIISLEKVVEITGGVTALTDDLRKFIQQSPLGQDLMISKVTDSLAAGQLEMELDLSIPYRNPHTPLRVNGKARLENTIVSSDLGNLRLTQVSGLANFTRTSLLAENLSAKFAGQDVLLSVSGSKNEGSDPPVVTISGTGDEEFIAAQVSEYFPKSGFLHEMLTGRLTGTTDWEASLTYHSKPDTHDLYRSLRIRSGLEGLAVDLPAPLGKQQTEPVEFTVERELDNPDNPILNLHYGSVLDAELRFKSLTDNTLHSAGIVFGTRTRTRVPDEGVMISGTIEKLSIDEWLTLLKQSESGAAGTLAVNTELLFTELTVAEQRFTDTAIAGGITDSGWQFTFTGDAIDGTLNFTAARDERPSIHADLNFLSLDPLRIDSKMNVNPAAVPTISARINSFVYAGNDFGTLELVTTPTTDGLSIDKLSLHKPALEIRASGDWKDSDHTGSSSDFSIAVQAGKFGSILETFGYGMAPIINGETSLLINANWRGTPADFSLDKLNGTLEMHISRGQLVDIKASAGRLFGLLSIQALPRRLSLDFADLFGKGLAFDKIEGNFVMENGDAYTSNLHMTGPSVDVRISGRTGLSEQDYDQRAVVVPQIAHSLPVTGALFGPVGIGLGAILYLTGKMFDPIQTNINKLLMVEYTITGSWDNPVVEKYRLEPEGSVIN